MHPRNETEIFQPTFSSFFKQTKCEKIASLKAETGFRANGQVIFPQPNDRKAH